MSKRSRKMMKHALSYAKMGFAVLPVHSIRKGKCTCGNSTCRRPGKHPHTKHGVKDATKNLDTIRGWWKKYPRANIAIATGEISGIIVLDIDPRNGGDDTIRCLELELKGLPKTVIAASGGGGTHYVFKYPSTP